MSLEIKNFSRKAPCTPPTGVPYPPPASPLPMQKLQVASGACITNTVPCIENSSYNPVIIITLLISSYYMTSSVSGQDEPNRAL